MVLFCRRGTPRGAAGVGKSLNDFGPVGLWFLETIKSGCPAGSWICESELEIQFREN